MSYDATAGKLELANVISDSCKKENFAIAGIHIDWWYLFNRQMIFEALDQDDTYGILTVTQRSSLESSARAVVNLYQYL